MNNQHPIVPSFELRNQWHSERPFKSMGPSRDREDYMVDRAAQWGADQELEACCKWVSLNCPYFGDYPMPEDKLRTVRRSKPRSLKEQALAALDVTEDKILGPTTEEILIRRALEALPND